jgi:two-component system, response regulator
MEEPTTPGAAVDTTTSKGRLVLLIDDNDDHAELVRRALHLSGRPHELVRLEDGEQALDFLRGARRTECALILLDLRLPRIGGLEVLRSLRQADNVLTAPVVVLTTSEADGDISAAYENGAHAYVVKPGDFTSFGELARDLAHFWLGWNKLPSDNP